MENNNSKLVEDLDNGDFLNEIIESNLEMDNLLLESNFVLETAESELKATIKEPSPPISDEDTSSALSIEVSEDLFKGYTSDVKFSPRSLTEDQKMVVPDDLFEGYTSDLKFFPLRSHSQDQTEQQVSDNLFKEYTSSVKFSPIRYTMHGEGETLKEKQNALVISENLNNILDDFNATLKNYNEQLNNTMCHQLDDIIDDNDKTLVAEQNYYEDTNKFVQIKPSIALNSEDEYNYLYADMYNTTLEITVPNINENICSSPKEEKLKHQDHFEGCSHEFDSRNVGNEFTVILNTESTAGKTDIEDFVSSEHSNDCKIIKTDREDFVSSEHSNDCKIIKTDREDFVSSEHSNDCKIIKTDLEDFVSSEHSNDCKIKTDPEDFVSSEHSNDCKIIKTDPEDFVSSEHSNDCKIIKTYPEDFVSSEHSNICKIIKTYPEDFISSEHSNVCKIMKTYPEDFVSSEHSNVCKIMKTDPEDFVSSEHSEDCKIIQTDPEDFVSSEHSNDCKIIKTETKNFVSSELSNYVVNKISEPTQYDFASDDINFPFLNVYETELTNTIVHKIIHTNTSLVNENLSQSVINNDHSDVATKTTDEAIDNIISGDMSVTYYNFIQSNIDNTIELSINKSCESRNNLETDLTQNNNVLKIPETTTEISLNENNNIVNLKRPAEDTTVLHDSKRQKLEEKPVSSSTIETIDDPTAEINFTQAIFDAEETADHNDPKWSELKDLETNEDYFKSVRTQWRSLSLPNPHKSNTTRYVPAHIANIKPETATSSENDKVISSEQYLSNRMQNISKEINHLVAKLNHMPRFKSRAERNRIHNELEHLRNLQHEVEKNQEEVKHINMFYYNDDQGWNANYLTRTELEELKEQDKVMEFQKAFYKP